MKLFKIAIASVIALGMSIHANAEEHMKSLNPNYFDLETSAGTDFYNFVNRGWLDSHPLTPEHSRYGQFDILVDSSNNRVKSIVTNLAATNPQPGTVAHKVSTIYELAMDSVRRNAEGACALP